MIKTSLFPDIQCYIIFIFINNHAIFEAYDDQTCRLMHLRTYDIQTTYKLSE